MNQMEQRSALIGYATETGNAQDCAEELQRILKRIHFQTQISQLDDINLKTLSNHTVVIIAISTTGQGDIPINGRRLWRQLLVKKLPPNHLAHVQIAVFGLGDSSYPKFNWAARKLRKRLVQLGANEVYALGEADEQHEDGLDATFLPWSSDLRNNLLREYPLPADTKPIPESDFLVPEWQLSLQSHDNNPGNRPTTNGFPNSSLSEGQQDLNGVSTQNFYAGRGLRPSPQNFIVKLEKNDRVTPESHWQDVRHLTFTSQSSLDYSPGDILTIRPKNADNNVKELLARMNWVDYADETIRFTPTKANPANSLHSSQAVASLKWTTLRELLTECLDITAIPRRSFFTTIAHFSDDPSHKERLLEFTKPELIDELYDYTTRPRRSILEVLQEFDSVKVPWYLAASVFPQLRGRQFSIASGGVLKKSSEGKAKFDILVAIVKYKTVIKKIREGVCTRYLASLPLGSEISVTIQKGGLGVRTDEAWRPVIMIGPGTGIAPMRSLIWERRQWLDDPQPKAAIDRVCTLRESKLFFGCRSQAIDYFYRSEWEQLQGEMQLEVYPAFSRDQPQKIYVQDLIRQQSELVYTLLHEDGGLVYVCGSSGKMPQAVRSALVDVFKEKGEMDQGAAETCLEKMEKEGRYKQETW